MIKKEKSHTLCMGPERSLLLVLYLKWGKSYVWCWGYWFVFGFFGISGVAVIGGVWLKNYGFDV